MKDENEAKPIAVEILESARLKFKRKLASLLLRALAESGMTTEAVEHRARMKRGAFMAYVNSLVKGKHRGMDAMIDIATALDGEIEPSMQMLSPLSAPNPHHPGEQKHG